MIMKVSTFSSSKMESTKRQRPFYYSFLSTMVLFSGAFFVWSAFFVTDHKEGFSAWRLTYARQTTRCNNCETLSRPQEIKSLPRGIVSKTSDLQMQPLWGPRNKKNPKGSTNLLAMAVGIKQKESVNKIVKKFLSSNTFVVMLFHYDGIVNDWREFDWSDRAIHVSATNQTKWWFAKRFLHPDIVSDYAYIFLWDEDLGVEHFHVDRYVTIIKKEGLQISQPALDLNKSEVHHPLTARDSKQSVHRKVHAKIGARKCDENSTEPPCTGWVEMMAPVFSTASWRCAWHLIQNDLIHAWGLDFQLGYCAQGDRTKNIGIVDSEYIIHYGLPTLGGSAAKKALAQAPQSDARNEVRKLSYIELEIFKNRWKKAIKEDEDWIDPYAKKQPQDRKS